MKTIAGSKPESETRRKRWSPEEHKKWMKKMWGNQHVNLIDKYLQADRDSRMLFPRV